MHFVRYLLFVWIHARIKETCTAVYRSLADNIRSTVRLTEAVFW